MGKIVRRVLVLGFFLVTSVAPTQSASANTDPAVAGDCATTLGGDGGKALTLDPGAAVGQPGTLAVGTGSDSANDPAAHIDIADTAKSLQVSSLPGAGAAQSVCTGAQGVVNGLSATTQKLLDGRHAPATAPSGPSRPPATAPGGPTPGSAAGPDPSSADFLSYSWTGSPLLAAPDLSSLLPPLALAPSAQDAAPPTGTQPGPIVSDSGSAEALPASSSAPAKLPLMLAAIALALVAAGLAHTWLRRTTR